MPNWCENVLGVAGKLPLVKQFVEDAKNEVQSISFQKLYPASTSEDTVKTGPFERIEGEPIAEARLRWFLADREWSEGHIDRIEKWGVKWDASACDDPSPNNPVLKTDWNFQVYDAADDDEVVAIYTFDTAWDPPVRLFDKVSKDYPGLKFRLKWVTEGPTTKGLSEWVAGVRTRYEASEWEALDCLDWL